MRPYMGRLRRPRPSNTAKSTRRPGPFHELNIAPCLRDVELLSPLGSLSILPREIRDEVYRNIFLPQYLVTLCKSEVTHQEHSAKVMRNCAHTRVPHEKTLALLRVSQQIHTEAIEILMKESSFQFNLEKPACLRAFETEQVKWPSTTILSRMQNIYITIDAGFPGDIKCLRNHAFHRHWNPGPYIRDFSHGSIERFATTTGSKRSICLQYTDWIPMVRRPGSSGPAKKQAKYLYLNGLKGFDVVIFEVLQTDKNEKEMLNENADCNLKRCMQSAQLLYRSSLGGCSLEDISVPEESLSGQRLTWAPLVHRSMD